jgi:hypothetical protein
MSKYKQAINNPACLLEIIFLKYSITDFGWEVDFACGRLFPEDFFLDMNKNEKVCAH